MKHSKLALLAITATVAALTIAAPAEATVHTAEPTHPAAAQPLPPVTEPVQERGFVGNVLDLLLGTPPKPTVTSAGLTLPPGTAPN
ncbi:hypothetical protein GCM10010503_35250 [Streptomyces lucensis JCM 4490]|uniref:Secreted protein n=1 Tax=Streptomyces lucensis JCM 4490 TaxID=1306176 RepID=A0A918J9K3_9ACTN|nr:hypothetical protein [Streptomyces lucensis]GGW55177.1 hypothetical protein GCM10010503_35250 [Streptomyces lucensis JCM 4490]